MEAVILLIFAVLLILSLHYCQAGDKADCEARGGAWLWRESACVQGPPTTRSGGG